MCFAWSAFRTPGFFFGIIGDCLLQSCKKEQAQWGGHSGKVNRLVGR